MQKSFDKIYVLLNKFSKNNTDCHGEVGRHKINKVVGVLEIDIVSTLSGEVDSLANQFNRMVMVLNK